MSDYKLSDEITNFYLNIARRLRSGEIESPILSTYLKKEFKNIEGDEKENKNNERKLAAKIIRKNVGSKTIGGHTPEQVKNEIDRIVNIEKSKGELKSKKEKRKEQKTVKSNFQNKLNTIENGLFSNRIFITKIAKYRDEDRKGDLIPGLGFDSEQIRLILQKLKLEKNEARILKALLGSTLNIQYLLHALRILASRAALPLPNQIIERYRNLLQSIDQNMDDFSMISEGDQTILLLPSQEEILSIPPPLPASVSQDVKSPMLPISEASGQNIFRPPELSQRILDYAPIDRPAIEQMSRILDYAPIDRPKIIQQATPEEKKPGKPELEPGKPEPELEPPQPEQPVGRRIPDRIVKLLTDPERVMRGVSDSLNIYNQFPLVKKVRNDRNDRNVEVRTAENTSIEAPYQIQPYNQNFYQEVPIELPKNISEIIQQESPAIGLLRPKFIIPSSQIFQPTNNEIAADQIEFAEFDFVQPGSEGGEGNNQTNILKRNQKLNQDIRYRGAGLNINSLFGYDLQLEPSEKTINRLFIQKIPPMTFEEPEFNLSEFEVTTFDPSNLRTSIQMFSPYNNFSNTEPYDVQKSILFGVVP